MKHFHGGDIVVVLVSPVCMIPEFFSCVTDMDIFDKVFIIYGTDGGACIQ